MSGSLARACAAALSLGLILTQPALAGSWTWTDVGPGTEPNSRRIRVDISAETGSQCPDNGCAWSDGYHWADILPAPLSVSYASPTAIPGGTRIELYLSNPDEGYYYVDLDPAQSYDFGNASTSGSWLKFEVGNFPYCTTSDICTAYDTDYVPFEVIGTGVAVQSSSWSMLKARF